MIYKALKLIVDVTLLLIMLASVKVTIQHKATYHSPTIKCVVTEVYDGDTFYIDIADIHPVFGERIGVRVLDIDCPEVRSLNKEEKQLAHIAKSIAEYELRGFNLELEDVKRDKYFRLLARVKFPDGRDFSEMMLDTGLAKKYNGGTKESWKRI